MELIIAGTSAAIAGAICNPLEVVKIRMQLQGELKGICIPIRKDLQKLIYYYMQNFSTRPIRCTLQVNSILSHIKNPLKNVSFYTKIETYFTPSTLSLPKTECSPYKRAYAPSCSTNSPQIQSDLVSSK